MSTNSHIAERLREAADLLQQQGANPFRVSSYRRAAETVSGLDRDLRELVAEEGQEALTSLPRIGAGIGGAVAEMLRTGRWSFLERLRGRIDPVKVFQTIPGIGPKLAERIHDTLEVDSLEALEVSAHDGRLEEVPGMGPRRCATVRAVLDKMLSRFRPAPRTGAGPPVKVLLDVDREYRRRADQGDLPTIAPRRFNPERKAWLPILHADREEWHFTALYSNSARAHQLGRTRDWVVIYFYDHDHREGQCTVVTETQGPLAGKRVVRGRESDCRAYYGTVSATEFTNR